MGTTWRITALSVATALICGALTVASTAPADAGRYDRTNGASITMRDYASTGSFLDVNGVGGVITDVNVTLNGLGHPEPFDADLMLIAPNGTTVALMSDTCGNDAVEDRVWTFDDEAASFLSSSDCTGLSETASVRPTDFGGGDFWPPGPAPAITLSTVDGGNPNGRWGLYVADDAPGVAGDIEGGWTLTITTGPAPVRLPASTTGAGKSGPYPVTRSVSGRSGVISDVDVRIDGFWHGRPDDIDLLLVGPRGQTTILMSDACGSNDATDFQYQFSDENSVKLRDSGTCFTSAVKPTSFETGDILPAPAPPGPYGTRLSVFDGTNPNGTWRLYVFDDRTKESGFLTTAPKIIIKTTPARGR